MLAKSNAVVILSITIYLDISFSIWIENYFSFDLKWMKRILLPQFRSTNKKCHSSLFRYDPLRTILSSLHHGGISSCNQQHLASLFSCSDQYSILNLLCHQNLFLKSFQNLIILSHLFCLHFYQGLLFHLYLF